MAQFYQMILAKGAVRDRNLGRDLSLSLDLSLKLNFSLDFRLNFGPAIAGTKSRLKFS